MWNASLPAVLRHKDGSPLKVKAKLDLSAVCFLESMSRQLVASGQNTLRASYILVENSTQNDSTTFNFDLSRQEVVVSQKGDVTYFHIECSLPDYPSIRLTSDPISLREICRGHDPSRKQHSQNDSFLKRLFTKF